jgi:hypothetical protein
MSRPEPPDWGNDPLSKLFKDADYNARVTAANYPRVFESLQMVDAAFSRAREIVEKDSSFARLVPRFLLVRTHSSFLAAIRAGMSGQIGEAFVLLRAGVEQSWYALHMATGHDADRRTEIWLRRNESDAAKASCKSEFTVKNVRSTHEDLDAPAAADLHQIYETLVDYGAHPNQMGVFTSIKSQESATEVTFQVGILHPAELPVMVTLRLAIAVAIGALKIFQLIYPERFILMGLDSEIQRLVVELNSQFKRFGSQGGSTLTA